MDDLISRQAAYDTLTEYYHQKTETQHESLKEALSRVPTIAPEQEADLSEYSDRLWRAAYERGKTEAQKTGHWIREDSFSNGIVMRIYKCSECNKKASITEEGFWFLSDFCPHCGAKMDGGEK